MIETAEACQNLSFGDAAKHCEKAALEPRDPKVTLVHAGPQRGIFISFRAQKLATQLTAKFVLG